MKRLLSQKSLALAGRPGIPRNIQQWKKVGIIYLIMLPALVMIIIFAYTPMAGGFIIAFKNYKVTRGIIGSDWVGLANFSNFLSSPFFPMVMRNTLSISLAKLAFGFPLPIILAMMLNEIQSSKLKRSLQTAYYLPHFISWVVIANLLMAFFAPNTGALNGIFKTLGISYNPFMSAKQFPGFLVVTDIWKDVGWSSIIYLAAISAIDPTLYEAAVIDGANKYHLLRHITLMSLLPTIMTMLLLRVGHILNAGFFQIFILQNTAVYRTSEILDTYAYKVGILQGNYSVGTVVGLFKSIIGLVMVVIVNKLSARLGTEVI